MHRLALIIGVLMLATAAHAQPVWQTTTADNAATAEMPGKADYTPKPITSKDTPTYTMHQYIVEADDRSYVMQTAVYPSTVKADLPAGIKGAAKGLAGGKWESVRRIKHAGLTAMEAVGVKDGSAIRSYSVVK